MVIESPTHLEDLVEDFARIKGPSTSLPTFLEITQFPHFELVSSNLLAFFLDPEGDHGLGTLFLDALLAPIDLERFSFRSVQREAPTENGKRLDIVIEGESHVIGVENKVFAPVNNPLREYRSHLRRIAKGRQAVLMILGLREPAPETVPSDLLVVTYEQLMGRVRENFGAFAADAPAQYLTFALDFVKTMENLKKGSRMNQAVLELFRSRQSDVIDLLDAAHQVSKELRRIVQQLAELVSEKLADDLESRVRAWFYQRTRELTDDLVNDVRYPSGAVVAIDTWLSMEGWQVVVWQRKSVGPKLRMPELTTWLQRQGVKFHVDPGTTGDWSNRLVTAIFPFDAPLEDVAEYVSGVVTAIARSHGAPGEER